MGSKVRVLSSQIDHQLAHLRWETAFCLGRGRGRFVKQAEHAWFFKPFGLVVQRAWTSSDCFGAFSCCLAEKYDRAQPLIDLLFREDA